jgi:sugar (pentulose or hexulose) kinase
MTAAGLTLGIDLGTSAVKVAAVDRAGRVVASGQGSFQTHAHVEGQAEQSPKDWLHAVEGAVASVAAMLGPGWGTRVEAIGLAGQLPTLVCLGPRGVTGPAITWADARADAWVTILLDQERRAWLYGRTGMPIDGRYLAPMFRFHWRERQDEVRRVLSAKDYLCYALTGALVTDPATAAGYGVYGIEGRAWDSDLCSFWELDPALLPPIRPAAAVAGGLDDFGARLLGLPAGVPVGVGTADSVAGALAMGGLEEGTVIILLGSSAVVMDASPHLRLDPQRRYLLTPHAVEGMFAREMDVVAAGAGFRWLCELLGASPDDLAGRAMRLAPGARGLLFAPYVGGGEQGALWNPELRGVLHGLGTQHGPAHLARAFLEGLMFEIRRCIDVLAEAAPVERVVACGPMLADDAALSMMADALARPVHRFASVSPSALGAALLAGAAGASVRPPQVPQADCTPGPEVATYADLYDRYRSLFPQVALPSGPR